MKDSKGHGSNTRGTHASAIEKIGNIQLHPNVVRVVKKNPNGFSVKPATGAMPKTGYMVSIPGHTSLIDAANPGLVARYAQEHADALQSPGAHIGGWTNRDNGKVYLDVSHNIQSRSKAIKAGIANNQIKIWDVKRKREIDTGGTGV